MVFEMPEEISGQKNSNVLCQGRIIRAKETSPAKEASRSKETSDGESGAALAASILDYKFLHQS
jgi:hypothetical protein